MLIATDSKQGTSVISDRERVCRVKLSADTQCSSSSSGPEGKTEPLSGRPDDPLSVILLSMGEEGDQKRTQTHTHSAPKKSQGSERTG